MGLFCSIWFVVPLKTACFLCFRLFFSIFVVYFICLCLLCFAFHWLCYPHMMFWWPITGAVRPNSKLMKKYIQKKILHIFSVLAYSTFFSARCQNKVRCISWKRYGLQSDLSTDLKFKPFCERKMFSCFGLICLFHFFLKVPTEAEVVVPIVVAGHWGTWKLEQRDIYPDRPASPAQTFEKKHHKCKVWHKLLK